MPIQSWGKSGILAYFGTKIGYFGHIFWDMDFKFVLPIMSIKIKGQTKLGFNWTEIGHFSLQKQQKRPYLKIPFCPMCQSLLQHFHMNLPKIKKTDSDQTSKHGRVYFLCVINNKLVKVWDFNKVIMMN